MEQQQRRLHSLEKIVAWSALLAVFALTVGFAQAQNNVRKEPGKKNVTKSAKKVSVTYAAGGTPAAKKKKVAARKSAPRAAAVDPLDKLQAANPGQLFLHSSVAYVQDIASGESLLAKNSDAVLPIASITKLMTAMVTLDRKLDLDMRVVISEEDMDHLKGTRSRLRTGGVLTRDELLLLALMASENRAAAALGRTYPGGTDRFVNAMNEKARSLGMADTRFADSSGLNAANVSSARDLAKLVQAAYQYPVIREYSTRDAAEVQVLGQPLQYRNTNGLVRASNWEIALSKTGFINEAGRCLVMHVRMQSKDMIVVLLDSWGRNSRIGDANRIKKWLETSAAGRPHS